MRNLISPHLSKTESESYSFLGEARNLAYRSSVSYSITKRAFDIVVASLIVVSILLWLVPLLGLLIKVSSPGPILFVRMRTGRNGLPFYELSFRTMYYNKSESFKQYPVNDKRFTPIGRFLRKTNLDRIPQFFNVLAGDMSIVGPRLKTIQTDVKYWKTLPNYSKRYAVKPGITGFAQLRLTNDLYESHQQRIINELRYDMLYINKQSLALDLLICWWTQMRMINGRSNAW